MPLPVQFIHRHPHARALVVSHRLTHTAASRCMGYECEDVAASCDAVDVIAPTESGRPSRWRRRFTRSVRRLGVGRGAGARGARPHDFLDRRYDLLFMHVQSLRDLEHCGSLWRWHAAAERSVCYIDELWRTEIERKGWELSMLRGFDLVAVGCEGSVAPLERAVGRPCIHLPPGLDTLRFCPLPDPPQRLIDLWWMGRRSPHTHRALLEHSSLAGLFYMYDTLGGYAVKDHAEHRRLLAETLKRTRWFVTYRARCNDSGHTSGQQEIGFRYYEAAAAGAVMIGECPQSPSFRAQFPWDDAVVAMPYGTADVATILERLDAAEERLTIARARGVRHALLHFDWLHRWNRVLESIEMNPATATTERMDRLNEFAERPAELTPAHA